MRKAKEICSKEKAAEYYLENKEATKEKSRKRYKNLSKEEKDKIKEYQRKRYQQLIQYKKEALQNKWVLFFLSIKRMSEKSLKFDDIRVNTKEFYKSKQAIDLDLVNVDQIVTSDKFKQSVLSCRKWVNTQKTCLSWLKMMRFGINAMKFVTRLRIS